MRQSNNIDDAMNDVVMVVDHQQKKRMVLYNIRSRYINLEFVLGVQPATTCSRLLQPACIVLFLIYIQR